MRLRRRSVAEGAEETALDEGAADAVDTGTRTAADSGLLDSGLLDSGPLDSGDVDEEVEGRIDLGSLLIVPEEDRELRLQVDEASGQVQAVLLAGADGAVDLRAFAAPRHGDLWTDVRPQIAADLAQHGGVTGEREGPFGTELLAQVGTGQGNQTQVTRIIGVNGPRWLLRATLYGRPAVEPDSAEDWEQTIRRVVVHRGNHAVPPGEALPVTMPPQARKLEQ